MIRYPLLTLPLALVAAAALMAASSAPARAQIDVSGDWTVTVEGDFSATCGLAFDQAGTSLDAQLDCGGIIAGPFSGTINQATGAFSLTGTAAGFAVNFSGDVSADGQTMSGSWNAPSLSYTGTFTGARGTHVFPTPLPIFPTPLPTARPISCPASLSGVVCLPVTGAGESAWSEDGAMNALVALIATAAVLTIGAIAFALRRGRSTPAG